MPENETLSEREREVLRLVATGASNKEIAQKLAISTNTVKVHLRNIFAKIGAASRTEATLYAIREGLVQVDSNSAAGLEAGASSLPPQPLAPAPRRMEWRRVGLFVVPAFLVLVLAALGASQTLGRPATTASPSPVGPTDIPRWRDRAALPTARSGLAAAAYENRIYAMGGQTEKEVVGVTERYNPTLDSWATLASKPTPVADISAVAIGGRIFVPGGRLATGAPTRILEIYDVGGGRWQQGQDLPVALSGYALVAWEGHLYLFGGWDGQHPVASVYEYDPGSDSWQSRTPMPTARAFAGAAISTGKIYVVGGYDGNNPLAVNEEYVPERDNGHGTPWTTRAPLPSGRYSMGVASIAELVHIIGGKGEENKVLTPLEYLQDQDKWQAFDAPAEQDWSQLAFVSLGTELFGLGGQADGKPTGRNESYQAIYTYRIVPPGGFSSPTPPK